MTASAELEANRTRQHIYTTAQQIIAAAASDRALRHALLQDARGTLAAHGLTLPPELTVRCIDAAGPVLVLPDLIEELHELGHEELVGVNGGEGSSILATTPTLASTTALCGCLVSVIVSVAVTEVMWD